MESNKEDRARLIREGNKEFNSGNIRKAARIYESTNYKDGLIRVGDHFYKKHQPLIAYGYYRKADYKPMLESLQESFVVALKVWLTEDEPIEEITDIEKERAKPSGSNNTIAPQLGREQYKKN